MCICCIPPTPARAAANAGCSACGERGAAPVFLGPAPGHADVSLAAPCRDICFRRQEEGESIVQNAALQNLADRLAKACPDDGGRGADYGVLQHDFNILK